MVRIATLAFALYAASALAAPTTLHAFQKRDPDAYLETREPFFGALLGIGTRIGTTIAGKVKGREFDGSEIAELDSREPEPEPFFGALLGIGTKIGTTIASKVKGREFDGSEIAELESREPDPEPFFGALIGLGAKLGTTIAGKVKGRELEMAENLE